MSLRFKFPAPAANATETRSWRRAVLVLIEFKFKFFKRVLVADLYILKAFYCAKQDISSLTFLDGDTVVDVSTLCSKPAFASDPDSAGIRTRCAELWMRDSDDSDLESESSSLSGA